MKNDGDEVVVISGLEAVRRRPGMYIGDTQDGSGMHHMLWQAVSAAVEEHLAGSASHLRVTIHEDHAISVEDDGRGISVRPSPIDSKTVLELVMTHLHASPASLAVVNALSSRLEVRVWWEGHAFAHSYAAGAPLGPVRDLGPADRTGTRITFTPDFGLLARLPWDRAAIARRLRELAALNPRLTVIFEQRAFRSPDGLADHVRFLGGRHRPLHGDPVRLAGARLDVGVDVALLWTGGRRARVRGFVGQDRIRRGTHLQGLYEGLYRAFVALDPARFGTVHRPAFAEVLHPGLVAAVAVDIEAPHFDTWRDRLLNLEARHAVVVIVAEQLGARLAADPALRQTLLARMPR